MIDIYKYIDSKDIREFHIKRKTVFNPTEEAIIINRCESIGGNHKLKLLNELLSSNSPDEFVSEYSDGISEDVYGYISTSVNYKRRALSQINKESNGYIFMLETSEIEDGISSELSNDGYFSSFNNAYENIINKCIELEKSDINLYSIITKVKLNSYENPTVYIFNNNTMINIKAGDDPTFFDDAEFHIDVPFSAGDIVKYKSISTGEFYGVLSDDIRKDRYPNKIGNFNCSLDCFDSDECKFYYTGLIPCIYLEKCSVSELPENQRILIAISDAYKDNKKFINILMNLQNNSLNKLAEEAYESFMINKENKQYECIC